MVVPARPPRPVERNRPSAGDETHLAVGSLQPTLKKVHLRLAQERCHEPVSRPIVQLSEACQPAGSDLPPAPPRDLPRSGLPPDRGSHRSSWPAVADAVVSTPSAGSSAIAHPGSTAARRTRTPLGCRTKARPNATRCRWPPESCPGNRSSKSSISSVRAVSRTRSVDLAPLLPAQPAPPPARALAKLQAHRQVPPHRKVRIQGVALKHQGHIALAGRTSA